MKAEQIKEIKFFFEGNQGKLRVTLENGQQIIFKEFNDVVLDNNEASKRWLVQHYGYALQMAL